MHLLNLNIAIYDQDLDYAQALSHHFLTVKGHQFSVNLFSVENQLMNYLQKNSLDILLISDTLYPKINNHKNIELTILLIEDLIRPNLLELPYIEKYQKGREIVYQIVSYYTLNSHKEISGYNHKPKLIGIYSPTGGCGKTTISLGIAKALALQGNSTLFISLESIPSYISLLGISNQGSISDLFYYFSQNSENLLMKLEGIRGYDDCSGLYFLPPPLHPNDITSFSEDDWILLIKILIEKSNYKYIIIDFTCEYSKRNIELIDLCNQKIYLLEDTLKSYSQLKYLKNLKGDTSLLLKTFSFVINNSKHIISCSENIHNGIHIAFQIPYIASLSKSESYLNFEEDVREYMRELLEVILKTDE